ncbi:MAG: ABC transporter ATP-binding protein [Spirochaetota bacterium]
MDRVVALENIAISFGSGERSTRVIEDVSLEIERGELIVVFGVSGVGKSTLLRVVCGLVEPSAGSVEIDGLNEPGSRPFGFVFQEPRLFPWRRVGQNVALGLEGLDLSKDEQRERVTHALRLVGLTEYVDRFPRQLSGGQRQRVGIARALAVRPSLLLMDEPFSSLDTVARRTLQQELIHIWHTTHTSIFFVTHDVEEAVFLADRIVLLAGSPARVAEIYRVEAERPRHVDDPQFQSTLRRLREDLHAYQGQPVI